MNFNLAGSGDFAMLVFAGSVVLMILQFVVHVAFAVAVYDDAQKNRGQMVLVSPGIWTLATLLGGVFVGVAYWAVHYSMLRRRPRG